MANNVMNELTDCLVGLAIQEMSTTSVKQIETSRFEKSKETNLVLQLWTT